MRSQSDLTTTNQIPHAVRVDAITDAITTFKMNDSHFVIVALDELTTHSHNSVNPNGLPPEVIQVGQLEVNGQPYVILQTAVQPIEADTNLAKLLTARELQVATLVALGQVNKQIATQLRISEWTVSTYLRRIFAKLGVDSRAAMVYRCASLIQRSQPKETA